MVRAGITIGLFFINLIAVAQAEELKLAAVIKAFHQSLVNRNTDSVDRQTDRALSYGHSNGWIETKEDMIKNLETGYIRYHSFKEDSLQVTRNGNVASARFIADINVTLHGSQSNFHLKVLEVWVKKEKRWILFARQAVK